MTTVAGPQAARSHSDQSKGHEEALPRRQGVQQQRRRRRHSSGTRRTGHDKSQRAAAQREDQRGRAGARNQRAGTQGPEMRRSLQQQQQRKGHDKGRREQHGKGHVRDDSHAPGRGHHDARDHVWAIEIGRPFAKKSSPSRLVATMKKMRNRDHAQSRWKKKRSVLGHHDEGGSDDHGQCHSRGHHAHHVLHLVLRLDSQSHPGRRHAS